MDTPYTQGFRAGMAWREAEIIQLINDLGPRIIQGASWDKEYLIALIKGEKIITAFLDDHAENMKDPDYAYEFGRNERELEIIKLLEDPVIMSNWWSQVDKNLGLYGNLKNYVIALIEGEK